MKKLKWAGLQGFNKLKWTPLDDPESPGMTGAFCKTYKNFSFYWILKAGHMVKGAGLDATLTASILRVKDRWQFEMCFYYK